LPKHWAALVGVRRPERAATARDARSTATLAKVAKSYEYNHCRRAHIRSGRKEPRYPLASLASHPGSPPRPWPGPLWPPCAVRRACAVCCMSGIPRGLAWLAPNALSAQRSDCQGLDSEGVLACLPDLTCLFFSKMGNFALLRHHAVAARGTLVSRNPLSPRPN
jgi:hypothetical protein